MGIFDSFNPLIKIAKQVVNSVRQQIMGQTSLLDMAVKAPIQAMVKQVVGGEWKGEGADAFVEECNKMFIPGTDNVMTIFRTMDSGIGRALDIMEAADAKATSIANDLDGIFRGIFK